MVPSFAEERMKECRLKVSQADYDKHLENERIRNENERKNSKATLEVPQASDRAPSPDISEVKEFHGQLTI